MGLSGAQALRGEGGENVNPHEPDALEQNERVRRGRGMVGNIVEPNDKTYMDKVGRGKAEAEIAPVPRQDADGRSEQ